MPSQTISISTPKGERFSGYLSIAEGGKGPGILMVQEIFGVNQSIREAADRFAAAGYTVLAPDLFWRLHPNVDITDQGKDLEQAFDYYHRFDVQQGIHDLGVAFNTLREHATCTGKAATLGFCLGGKMSYLTAANYPVDAMVAFYGGGIADHVNLAKNIHCPVLMHFGKNDEMIPADQIAKIKDAFAGRSDVEINVYAGVGHAFYNHRRANYNEAAAKLAYQRTLNFLAKTINTVSTTA